MFGVKLLFLFFALLHVIYESSGETTHRYEVIPERVEVTYTNDEYTVNATANVRRYNRRGSYVVSLWGYNKHSWGNNITIDVIFYEYLHNEYKRSFVELHYKLCDLINKDGFLGPLLRERGLKCPLDKGLNGILNATMSFPKFPYVFPLQKCKAEVIITAEPSHDLIGTGFLYLNIIEFKNKHKN